MDSCPQAQAGIRDWQYTIACHCAEDCGRPFLSKTFSILESFSQLYDSSAEVTKIRMGSGDWFKTIINLKKVKNEKRKGAKGSAAFRKSSGSNWKVNYQNDSHGTATIESSLVAMPVEDVAATKIQTAFRAFMARRMLRCLKGVARLQLLTQGKSVIKQASTTLNYLHSWSRVHSQIKARRLSMVAESRIKQKKLDHQLKLEAKLHDLDVEWSGGSDSMEETLARIQLREEAAVKRERAMAYAFSHQWRANHNQGPGTIDVIKATWGWSWTERWIDSRPWESRMSSKSPTQKKGQSKQANKVGKNLSPSAAKVSGVDKVSMPNGKGVTTGRRLSYPPVAQKGKINTKEADIKEEQLAT